MSDPSSGNAPSAPSPATATSVGAAPTTLKRFRVYSAKLETPDNPFTEHFVASYLTNMGFDNLTIKGEGGDIVVTGRYMGADGASIPTDSRLTVSAL